MFEFYLLDSRSPAFRYENQNKNHAFLVEDRTHDLPKARVICEVTTTPLGRRDYPSTIIILDGSTCVCFVFTYSKSMDHPGKVANPARGQLNRISASRSQNFVR